MVAAIKSNFDVSSLQGSDASQVGDRAAGWAKVSLVESAAHKTLSRIRAPAAAKMSTTTVAALSLTDATATFARRILQLTPSTDSKRAISNLDCLSSGIGLLLGSAVTIGNGISELNLSKQIGDGEGVRRSRAQIVSGLVSTNASALSLANETAFSSVAAVGLAESAFCGLGAAINIGISGWNIYRCARFLSKIDAILDQRGGGEKERLVNALIFLKERIAPTKEERDGISKEVETLHPDWGPQAKLQEVKKRTLDLAEVKVRQVKRRTCQATAERVLKEVDSHLEALQNPPASEASLKAAKGLIEEVKRQGRKKILLSAIVAVTSALALTALIIGTFFSLGTLPFALYAVSSAIALAILLYPLAAQSLGKSRVEAVKTRAEALVPLTIMNSKSN